MFVCCIWWKCSDVPWKGVKSFFFPKWLFYVGQGHSRRISFSTPLLDFFLLTSSLKSTGSKTTTSHFSHFFMSFNFWVDKCQLRNGKYKFSVFWITDFKFELRSLKKFNFKMTEQFYFQKVFLFAPNCFFVRNCIKFEICDIENTCDIANFSPDCFTPKKKKKTDAIFRFTCMWCELPTLEICRSSIYVSGRVRVFPRNYSKSKKKIWQNIFRIFQGIFLKN